MRLAVERFPLSLINYWYHTFSEPIAWQGEHELAELAHLQFPAPWTSSLGHVDKIPAMEISKQEGVDTINQLNRNGWLIVVRRIGMQSHSRLQPQNIALLDRIVVYANAGDASLYMSVRVKRRIEKECTLNNANCLLCPESYLPYQQM